MIYSYYPLIKFWAVSNFAFETAPIFKKSIIQGIGYLGQIRAKKEKSRSYEEEGNYRYGNQGYQYKGILAVFRPLVADKRHCLLDIKIKDNRNKIVNRGII